MVFRSRCTSQVEDCFYSPAIGCRAQSDHQLKISVRGSTAAQLLCADERDELYVCRPARGEKAYASSPEIFLQAGAGEESRYPDCCFPRARSHRPECIPGTGRGRWKSQ